MKSCRVKKKIYEQLQQSADCLDENEAKTSWLWTENIHFLQWKKKRIEIVSIQLRTDTISKDKIKKNVIAYFYLFCLSFRSPRFSCVLLSLSSTVSNLILLSQHTLSHPVLLFSMCLRVHFFIFTSSFLFVCVCTRVRMRQTIDLFFWSTSTKRRSTESCVFDV